MRAFRHRSGVGFLIAVFCISIRIVKGEVVASNVAEGKTVTMSSLYTSTQHGDGDWEHAVDGDTSQDWYAGGCASTNNEANPWLLLDLGDTFTVTSLKIFNREDGGFSDRLGDLSIQFGSTTTPPEIATYSGTFPLEDTIQFDMPYTGRYLRISMARTEFLTICELELYGFAAITSPTCGLVDCDQGEACDYGGYPGPVCVPMNNCTGREGEGCYHGLRCCGLGIENCVCESPKMFNTMGLCKDCDCMWNERCTVPHGKCACGDYLVRDHYGNCVECDPELSCPKCSHDRTCSINPGDKSSSCECLPGSVERDGECVWCKPCPRDCDRDHVCITPGFSDPYCGCPGGMDEIDGKCVTCPSCPDCGPDRKCFVRDGIASCECPHSTYDTPWGCIPLNTCPPCQFDDHEVCVLPKYGSPHCECADGYLRDRYHKCVACVQDECQANGDCTHNGEICNDGRCECADGWQLYDGECIPDGYLGGSCKFGRCHGKRTHCSSHGQCECNDDCYKEPIWTCIPKRKKYYW